MNPCWFKKSTENSNNLGFESGMKVLRVQDTDILKLAYSLSGHLFCQALF